MWTQPSIRVPVAYIGFDNCAREGAKLQASRTLADESSTHTGQLTSCIHRVTSRWMFPQDAGLYTANAVALSSRFDGYNDQASNTVYVDSYVEVTVPGQYTPLGHASSKALCNMNGQSCQSPNI
ncbi:hypothetical protein NUW54_g11313 [Trametes sanguinea]|uniref:Uncharacterized protein n=1 Tax=Trametes sanguinea TaxID=158606 RepID=A0ACC1NHH6_9APHY|nr:hypothetical protein NUW54_g11313 [Trametes sanguinea]